MCLDYTSVIGFDVPEGKVIAYKWVDVDDKGRYRNTFNYNFIQPKKWNHEPEPAKTIYYSDDIKYPRGFHALKTRDEARKYSGGSFSGWKLLKVELDDIHTAGMQSGCRVYVARKFRVIGEVR